MLNSLIILALNQTNSLPEELLLQITTELKSGNITYEDFFAEIKTSLELISEIRDELGMMGESIG